MSKTSLYLLALLLITGCGTRLAPELQQDPPGAPPLEQVRANPDAFRSQPVRWGGVILDSQNRDSSTWIRIVALELDGNGRPTNRDQTLGRFIAVVDRFLEPTTYSRDRLITVSGLLDGLETAKVGQFDYEYPIVKADVFQLWPKRRRVPMSPYPYYYWPYRHWYHPIYNPFPHHGPTPHLH